MLSVIKLEKFGGGATCSLRRGLEKNIKMMYNSNMRNYRFKGFTLAEVLITLGIIGVVAALTIPTLIHDVQDRQLRAMWKKKYAEIAGVYATVRQDNIPLCVKNSGDYNEVVSCRYPGDRRIDDRTNLSPEFVNEMVKHFKVIDSCGYPQYNEAKYCNHFNGHNWVGIHGFPATYSLFGSLKTGSIPENKNYRVTGLYNGWDIDRRVLLQADGSVIYFGGHGTPMIAVDVNGFEKGPNVVGRDLFAIILNENWIRPIGAEGTFNTLRNGEKCMCGKDYGLESAQGFLGSTDLVNGTVISGACCSAEYLYKK